MMTMKLLNKNDDILYINGLEFMKIPDFSNYFISQSGVIYSLKTNKFIKIKINKFGYYTVGITNDIGKRKFVMLHRLVYTTWNKFIDNDMQINHKNSKPNYNYLFNLEEVSALENIRHSIKYNTRENKWSNDQVYDICSYIEDGLYPDEIYNKMNLSENDITIKNFRSFCSYLKSKTKYWVDISSKFDFQNAYTRERIYDDTIIYKVLDMLDDNIAQSKIADKLKIDFRVVSEIKRGIKKPRDNRSTTIERMNKSE